MTQLLAITIESGQEVMSTLEQKLAELKITDGAIVSVIGAVDECCISNMPKDRPKEDVLNQYKEPFEMSGNGEIRDGKPHIHCIMSRINEETLAGHLHWAHVQTWYVKVFVIPL